VLVMSGSAVAQRMVHVFTSVSSQFPPSYGVMRACIIHCLELPRVVAKFAVGCALCKCGVLCRLTRGCFSAVKAGVLVTCYQE
jgi:hypothetical protein